jgi:hypothetical protein
MRLATRIVALVGTLAVAFSPLAATIRTANISPQYAATFLASNGKVARRVSFFSDPLTALPLPGNVLVDFNPDTLALSDGALVTSMTDSAGTISNGSITATAPSGNAFTYKTGIANGHSVLRATTSSRYLSLGHPTVLSSNLATPSAWSVMVVFRNSQTTGNYSILLGDVINQVSGSGITLGAGPNGAMANSGTARSYSSGDPASNIHTMVYSGDAGASTTSSGRRYLDGTMYTAFVPMKIDTNADPLYIGNSADSTGAGIGSARGMLGDIVRVIFWNTALSAPQVWQADAWARTTYGKALATAGRSFFTVWDGDSQTQGVGATGDTSMPVLTMNSLGVAQGGFANVGKSGATVQSGTNSGNNDIDSAARDVDGFHAVTGLPIVLVHGEWYNQGQGGGVTSTGASTANMNRTYYALRKAADPTVRIVCWTSLSSYNHDDTGAGTRTGFNSSLVSNPGSCSDVVDVSANANIGANGAAGTTAAASTYFADGIHLNSTGTPIHAALMAPHVHR